MNKSEHKFGPPIAGAGRLRICTVCGDRETAESKDDNSLSSSCSGRAVLDPACEIDYEPIE
jgi:hypothetical protein|tara:strand:- start:12433 stop:12615 length:183 start_codon:yes stop_codon:yes gene_type:complete